MLSATIEPFGGRTATRHRVRDVSPGGIRVDNVGALRPGATVLISVGALEAVGATVKWVGDGFAGLAFAEQIDPDDARRNAAIAPPRAAKSVRFGPQGSAAPNAGWVADLRDPYLK